MGVCCDSLLVSLWLLAVLDLAVGVTGAEEAFDMVSICLGRSMDSLLIGRTVTTRENSIKPFRLLSASNGVSMLAPHCTRYWFIAAC